MTYLNSLPVSHLKIDGGLVRDVVGNQRVQAMVTAIVQLARTMNLKTTAECIESEAIQAAVGALGVDFGQGFAIGLAASGRTGLAGSRCKGGSSGVVRQPSLSATARPEIQAGHIQRPKRRRARARARRTTPPACWAKRRVPLSRSSLRIGLDVSSIALTPVTFDWSRIPPSRFFWPFSNT